MQARITQKLNERKISRAGLGEAAGGRKAILVAAVLGLAAAALTWNYVQRANQAAQQKQAAMVPVVVAAADIPVRTQVQPQMLAVKQVPADARHPKAFTALEQVTGKVSNLPISAGEQVLNTKFFARKEDSGLAFRVPPGKRALSVNVSEVVTSGGLIVPGDFVDVIALFPPVEREQDTASIVLQDIEVLAVAQALQGPAADAQPQSGGIAGAVGGSKPEPRPEAVARPNARTATLAVTPDQAQQLIVAESKGSIRLALRAIEDHSVVDTRPTRLRDVRP